jgi:ferrous iron transport protein A
MVGDVLRRFQLTPRRSPENAAPTGAVALCDLAPNSRARVVTVSGDASGATARRLTDLGFTAGTVVEVVRRAPLRDPVVYRLRDYEVCLRRAQAGCVLVDVID